MVDHVGSEAAWLADPSKSAQDFYDYLTKNVTHTGLVQASVPLVGVIAQNGGVAPAADGHAIFTDPGGSNDTSRQLEIYDLVLGRTVGIPKKHATWASLPATGANAEQFYVTDLQITVEYRDATADAVLSGTGLAGWHPMGAGLMLVANATGSPIEANRPVALTGTYTARTIAKTTLDHQRDVLGVTLHSIADGAQGIVALPGYGNPVKVYVDPTILNGVTAIEVAAGDWLGPTVATAGVARSWGTLPSSGMPAAGQMVTGTPAGAFAIALEARASAAGAGTVMARMLPQIGQGADAVRAAASIYRDESVTDTTTATVQACRGQSGTNGAQSAADDTFISIKHLPILAVKVRVLVKGTALAGSSEISVGLDPDTATFAAAQQSYSITSQQGGATDTGFQMCGEVQTCDSGSATTVGNSFKFQIAGSNLSDVDHIQIWQLGYKF